MIMQVKKRDGRLTGYDRSKIENAVMKAFMHSDEHLEKPLEEYLNKVTTLVEDGLHSRNFIDGIPTVEEIQDIVEHSLLTVGLYTTAKNYILYRAERTRVREINGGLIQIMDKITKSETSETDLKRENANIDCNAPMGLMLKYGSEASKYYTHLVDLTKEASFAHKSGDIHIHDLDFYNLTMTCVQLDLEKLFENGFNTGHGVLREPNSIGSYASLACIAIQSSQNDMHKEMYI